MTIKNIGIVGGFGENILPRSLAIRIPIGIARTFKEKPFLRPLAIGIP